MGAVSSAGRLAIAATKKRQAEQLARRAASESKQAMHIAAQAKGVQEHTLTQAQEAKAELHAAQADRLVTKLMSRWAGQKGSNDIKQRYHKASVEAAKRLKAS